MQIAHLFNVARPRFGLATSALIRLWWITDSSALIILVILLNLIQQLFIIGDCLFVLNAILFVLSLNPFEMFGIQQNSTVDMYLSCD